MAQGSVELGVLGPLQCTVNGSAVSLGTPKQRAVLALLAINRNRPVSIDSLMTATWEQEPPAGARASLHTYVSNLRRLLSGGDTASHSAVMNAPPGYRLSIADDNCDIGRFIMKKNAGAQAAAAGRFEEASAHLADALSQWRGPALEDLRNFQFAEVFATALTEDKVVAHTAYAEAEIACGHWSEVISVLERLSIEHPYREPLWAQLITAYYLDGRQADALDAYRRLRTTLAEDLGIDPSPMTRDLHGRVLRQEALDVKEGASQTAIRSGTDFGHQFTGTGRTLAATLRAESGQVYPLSAAATRIGRLADNDIVLSDAGVSRHHAVIVDTGTSFVISDLRSANGTRLHDRRIQGSAALRDGDRIRICQYMFTFVIHPGTPHDGAVPQSASDELRD